MSNAIAVFNPSNEEQITEVPDSDQATVDAAVARARETFESGVWRKAPATHRAKVLFRAARIIEERADELAELESQDNGMNRDGRKHIIKVSVDMLKYYAGWVGKIHGESSQPGVRRTARHLRDLPHLHPARAGRRRRPHHPLERALLRRDAQGRARTRGGLQRRAQACRGDAAHRAEARGDLPRGGSARRRPQRHHRLRRDHGCGADRASGRRQDLVHRVDRGRPADRQGGRGQPQAPDARARRQVAADHVRRRQSRQGDHGRRHGSARRLGAELFVHLADLRPARHLRPGRRRPRRLRQDAADGRQRRSQFGSRTADQRQAAHPRRRHRERRRGRRRAR